MTPDELQDDVLLDTFRGLAAPEPDRASAARIRLACHEVLRRRAGLRHATRHPRLTRGLQEIGPLLISGLCATYLWEVGRRALWLFVR